MVTIDDVRRVALDLPRAYEALVRGRVKFRVGQIVFVAFSRDESLMGFGFPREEREALVRVGAGQVPHAVQGRHALPVGGRPDGSPR